ncbi:MAG: VWA domain-containing protein [Myxococcota bacterium]
MTDWVWGDVGAAIWGFVVLGLLFGFIGLGLWRRARLEDLAARGPLPGLLRRAGTGRNALRAGLVLASAALVVVGLMRPQGGTRATELKNLGIDIAVAVDASKSMKAGDVVPDRLGAARAEVDRLLDSLSGGRVGLVPFAGLAFVQTPLTSDFDVIRTYLDELRVEDMPRGGTALGRALIEAIRALVPRDELEGTLAQMPGRADEAVERAPADDTPGFEGSEHKAIVVFTDGENHEGEPREVARLAAELGIRIYTVGVGTAQGRPVPMVNEQGQVVGTMKGPDGRTPLFSELNEELLREIARTTGGEYWHLGPQGMGDGLLKAVDRLEKKEYEATFQHLRDDRFQIALVPALVLLVLEALLAGRPRRRRRSE